ncbi:SDR family NAD(P)-dependent oxidoreductase [Methylocystis hirsuta]|uniref:SDR family NAD(P)-dependent oxidoreductase n=1 Tax=Methylocystis hirsuta TaxID=369798 RepID=A0A3M9XUX0_9HYPH|nr:SDR family NAD(P)-dependent oxidoreductase [Methylocystis hirsuta]RNJ50858.1 SDR family NAD(P)-dependent oxidoreductase [Methylocystis hirsuta]
MDHTSSGRPLAVVTGASVGIGFELAQVCVVNNFDVAIASNKARIYDAAASLAARGASVVAIEADLSTIEGVDRLYDAAQQFGRPVDVLIANAGIGLGNAFLDQDFQKVRDVIDTNITGTVYAIQKFGRDMRNRNSGRILIVGSIAGMVPGTFQAVYNGTKAFLENFAFALRNELKDTTVTVSLLMPGMTETDFFRRADMLDTRLGQARKANAADVARDGFDAMMQGQAQVVSGWRNKISATFIHAMPATFLAKQHRRMAKPDSARR